MQIHEVTKDNKQINEGLASTLGNLAGKISAKVSDMGDTITGGGEFKAAMNDPKRQQQIKMLSDQFYLAWKAYEKTLLQANPDAREGDMYEKALLAFVTKNLLGGQYLPNVINKDQIISLVKQLSGSSKVMEAEETIGAVKAGAPTAAERAKLQQMIADKTKAQTPATATPATATPTPKPAVQSLSPQQEKDLWFKLTQQAAVAQAQTPGMFGGTATNQPTASQQPNTQANVSDARTYVTQLTQSIDPAVSKGLTVFGSTAVKNIGSNTVKSTGNPVADALLLMAGFQGI
jgi:hypothetical protein